MSYLSTLLAQAPRLKGALQPLDRWNLVSQLAGLLTWPECQANNLRLESMVHLAVAISTGKGVVGREDLERLFADHLTNTDLARAEDPLEDVFVSNVFEGSGNHRIFEGIWERNDYCLQTLLRACKLLGRKHAYELMMQNVGAMLDLSEAVAERNGLERNSVGGGEPGGPPSLPKQLQLDELARHVTFSTEELKSLRINPEELAPFVWQDKAPEKLVAAKFNQTPLERRPVLLRQGVYLLALPTAVSIACRRYILEVVDREGDLKKLDYELSHAQAHAGERALTRLRAKPWNPDGMPRPKSHGVVSLTLMGFQFDRDKFGVLVVVQPPLETALKHGFGQYQDYVSRGAPVVADLCRVAEFLESQSGFRHGLFIFAIGGVGMPLSISNPLLSDKWVLVSYSIADLDTLCHAKDADLGMVWRLSRQHARARDVGVKIFNPNGDLNLFALWQNAEYSLFPADVSPSRGDLFLIPPLNAILELRIKARRAVDAHVAPRNEPHACYVEVERKNPYAWFKSLREAPIYASARPGGQLLGVTESPGAWWWVTTGAQPRTRFHASLTYQVWDCICNWSVKVGAELSRRFPTNHLVSEIRLNFVELNEWTQAIGTAPVGEVGLTWARTETGVVELRITREFFQTFMQPENRAERTIVTTLLEIGAYAMSKVLEPTDLREMTDRILPAGSGRCFHVIPADDATLTTAHGPADSSGLRDEVVSEVFQELGAAIAPELLGHRTNDPDMVRKLVRSAVAYLKDRISKRLQRYSLRETVLQCMGILDNTHRDFHRWKISAAALLAIYPDSEDVIGEANRREYDRAGASVAARSLIETALFSCPAEDGETPSELDLQEMLALAQVLIGLANYDLPKRSGFPAGSIEVASNGRFRAVNDFLDDLRQAYIRSTFDRGYRASAEQYEGLFVRESKDQLPPDFEELNAVLKAEFGISAVEAFDIGNLLNSRGMKESKSILIMPRSELQGFLAKEMDRKPEEIEQTLKQLSLYPRSAWDKDLPNGCDKTDTFPWRFKRRFGLLRRPFVEITQGENPIVVVSPFLVREALRYLINHCHQGEFPPQFYVTELAKEFVAKAVKRRSDAFVEHTAEVMRTAGYEVKLEVKMKKLGASLSLGDIDILAWRAGKNPEIWALECKALRNAKSTEEMLDQLDDFRGEAKDRLDRHWQRLSWLRVNQAALTNFTKLPAFRLDGRIVTSHQVPMQFHPDTKSEPFIVDIDSWEKWLASRG